MTKVRRASPADVAELVRLRGLMHSSMNSPGVTETAWRHAAAAMLKVELPKRPAVIAAFVVDAPEGDDGELAGCATGTIQRKLPSPTNPTGLSGYIFNVCTDPRWRRRGIARACMTALLDWFDGQGVGRVDLRASSQAQSLYTDLGFVATTDPSMRLDLKRR